MQPLRTSVGQVSRQLNRNMKPIPLRHFTSTPSAMSLFPRFTQDFAPMFRLFDEYDRQVLPSLDRQFNRIRSFSPKFDVKETTEGYELLGELPGVDQKDINIEWTDSTTLTISGRHEHVREQGRPQTIDDSETSSQKKLEHQPTAEEEANAPVDPSASTNSQLAAQPDQSEAVTTQQHQYQQQEESTPKEKYWVSERSVGEFHRSFSFPARVEQDAVRASLKNGILSVVVPRGAVPVAKKVVIE